MFVLGSKEFCDQFNDWTFETEDATDFNKMSDKEKKKWNKMVEKITCPVSDFIKE